MNPVKFFVTVFFTAVYTSLWWAFAIFFIPAESKGSLAAIPVAAGILTVGIVIGLILYCVEHWKD